MAAATPFEDAELYRQWHAEAGGTEPDASTLAAYAEGRLRPAAAAAVEAWLASHPTAAEDVAFARTLARIGAPQDALAERVAARAAALVEGPAVPPNVVPFRPRRQSFFMREAASWSALAASVALAAWLGFALGGETYTALANGDDPAAADELFEPASGFFGGFGSS
jgi:anti-sigma factor RsiW